MCEPWERLCRRKHSTCVHVGKEEGSSTAGLWGLKRMLMGPVHPPGFTQTDKNYSDGGALGEEGCDF